MLVWLMVVMVITSNNHQHNTHTIIPHQHTITPSLSITNTTATPSHLHYTITSSHYNSHMKVSLASYLGKSGCSVPQHTINRKTKCAVAMKWEMVQECSWSLYQTTHGIHYKADPKVDTINLGSSIVSWNQLGHYLGFYMGFHNGHPGNRFQQGFQDKVEPRLCPNRFQDIMGPQWIHGTMFQLCSRILLNPKNFYVVMDSAQNIANRL